MGTSHLVEEHTKLVRIMHRVLLGAAWPCIALHLHASQMEPESSHFWLERTPTTEGDLADSANPGR